MNTLIKYTLLFLFTSNVSIGQLSFPQSSTMDYDDSKNIFPWWPKNAKSALKVRNDLSNDNWNCDTTYYEFDMNNRISMLVENRFYNSELILDTIRYTYNSKGLWQKRTTLNDTTHRTFHYDKLDRLIQIDVDGSPAYSYEYMGDLPTPSIARFSPAYWNEYKYDSLSRIISMQKYKDSTLAEIYKYNQVDLKTEIFRISKLDNIYNDSTTIYFDEKYNILKKVYKTNEFYTDGTKPVYAITSYRYVNDNRVSLTDCLSNDASTGFSDYIYDDLGHIKEIVWYTDNGLKMTRHYFYYFEYR